MLMSPLGSLLGTHFHRQVLAALIYILDTISLVTAFAILPLSGAVIGLSVGMLVFGFAFFGFIAWLGNKIMADIEAKEEEKRVAEKEKEAANKGFDNEAFKDSTAL